MAQVENTAEWLLMPDGENPGVRYRALRELFGRPPDDQETKAALAAVMSSGPVPAILAAQHPDGYWLKPGPGYATKYQGTTWQLLLLRELGADGADARVAASCEYVLGHAQTTTGGFGFSGRGDLKRPPPSSVVHCLNGNLLYALIGLGWLHDARVQRAVEWQSMAVTGSDPEFSYYRSTTSGPGFACGVNLRQPCAWGAAKAMRGLLAIPTGERSQETTRALELGGEFLLTRDPAVADYPFTEKVSGTWFRLGFLSGYWSDVLEVTEILVDLGHGQDSRLDRAFELILGKRDSDGRWHLENTLNGKMWIDVEAKGKASKWVTLRALRTLKKAGRLP